MYEGNSQSNVPYFIPGESIRAFSWLAWVQLVHILPPDSSNSHHLR
jgi:hypothetical protein